MVEKCGRDDAWRSEKNLQKHFSLVRSSETRSHALCRAVTNNGAQSRSVICFAWFKAGFAALQTHAAKYAANLLPTFNEDKADIRRPIF